MTSLGDKRGQKSFKALYHKVFRLFPFVPLFVPSGDKIFLKSVTEPFFTRGQNCPLFPYILFMGVQGGGRNKITKKFKARNRAFFTRGQNLPPLFVYPFYERCRVRLKNCRKKRKDTAFPQGTRSAIPRPFGSVRAFCKACGLFPSRSPEALHVLFCYYVICQDSPQPAKRPAARSSSAILH